MIVSRFGRSIPHLALFLEDAKDRIDLVRGVADGSDNARFVVRNFLLDERLDDARLASYARFVEPSTPLDFEAWDSAHKRYLRNCVFVTPSADHDLRFATMDRPDICPETFRHSASQEFQATDRQIHLLRLVRVEDIAYLADEEGGTVWLRVNEWLRDPNPTNPARAELARILDQAASSPEADHRPVFATFYEDLLGDLGEGDWPDLIRDRLGLHHINQWNPPGLPARVVLFRYPVQDIPRKRGETGKRPIAVPSVLDHRFSAAFCPAPRELDRGRVVNLRAGANLEPAREVLHFFMRYQPQHIFRAGEVTRRVPAGLTEIRRDHLIWLQLATDRNDYAAHTDGDILKERAG